MQKITTPPFPETGIVRPAQVMSFLGLPRRTFYRWLAAGRLPQPQKWGNTSVWNAEEIRRFMRELHGPAADTRTTVRSA